MEELRESSPQLHSVEQLRGRLREDGYLFFRDLLPAARRAGTFALAALQRAGWLDGQGPAEDAPITMPPRSLAQYAAPVGSAGDTRWADEGYRSIASSGQFNRLPYEPAVRALMRHLFGPTCFSYPLKLLRIRYPAALIPVHDGNYVHQDFAVLAVRDMFTMWVPLIDISRDLGGLAVLPGSQRLGLQPLRLLRATEPGWATTDYRAGDVLVFHCLTSHAALANRTERLRLSAEFRWQLAEEPVPHHLVFGRPPALKEVWSERFAGTDWWVPVPPDLTFVDRPPRPVIREVASSRFVDLPDFPPVEYRLPVRAG